MINKDTFRKPEAILYEYNIMISMIELLELKIKDIGETYNIRQLEGIFDTLEDSGSSYMLLKGYLEDKFNHFKSTLENFKFEDLRNME